MLNWLSLGNRWVSYPRFFNRSQDGSLIPLTTPYLVAPGPRLVTKGTSQGEILAQLREEVKKNQWTQQEIQEKLEFLEKRRSEKALSKNLPTAENQMKWDVQRCQHWLDICNSAVSRSTGVVAPSPLLIKETYAWSCQLKNLNTETGIQSCVIATPVAVGHAVAPQTHFFGSHLEQILRQRLRWTTSKRPVPRVRETPEEEKARLFKDWDDLERATTHKLEILRNQVIRLCAPANPRKRRRNDEGDSSDSDSDSEYFYDRSLGQPLNGVCTSHCNSLYR